MNKIVSILLLLLISFSVKAQYPVKQPIGGPTTIVQAAPPGAIQANLITNSFTDTTAANLTNIKFYNGAIIRVGDLIYMRSNGRWVLQTSSAVFDSSTRVISGSVIWVSGFNFSNTLITYQIRGRFFSTPTGNFSITGSDPTYDRFTIVVADTNGILSTIDGTAGPVANIPTPNPQSQVLIATYKVLAASTQPQGLGTIAVYKENTSPEWTGYAGTSNAVFNYTFNPYQGLVSTYVPTITQGGYFYYADGVNHTLSNYSYLSFYVRNLATYNGYIYAVFIGANGWVSYAPVHTGTYGYSGTLLNQWQLVVIPINEVVSLQNTTTFTQILFDYDLNGTVSTGGMQFDNIILQTGGNNQSGSGVIKLNNQDGVVVTSNEYSADFKKLYWLTNGVRTDSTELFIDTLTAVPNKGIYINNVNRNHFISSSFDSIQNAGIAYKHGFMNIGDTIPVAPLHVGNRGNFINSNDPGILISRDVSSSSGSGSSHQFVSMPWYTRNLAGTGAVDYDARPFYYGTMNADHFVGFQNLPIWNSSGVATKAYGVFSALTINSGSVGTHYGVYIGDPIGAGTLNYNYGLYLPNFSKGLLGNYGVYQRGSNVNYFGGNVGFGDSVPTAKVHVFGATNREIQIGINTAGFDNNTFFPNYVSGDNNINMSRSTDGSFTESFFNYQATSGLSEIGIASRGGVTLHAGTDPANKISMNYLGGVGIGTMSQDASAQLDIVSTARGLLIPRLTTTEMNTIPSPAMGLMVWNTDELKLYEYTGVVWQPVGGAGGSLTWQQTIDASVTAGDNPIANFHDNDVTMDSIKALTISSNMGDINYNISTGGGLFFSANNNINGSGAANVIIVDDSSSTSLSTRASSAFYDGIYYQKIKITPKEIVFNGEQDDYGVAPKIRFENIETMPTPPTYIAGFDGDTLKKVLYPVIPTIIANNGLTKTGNTIKLGGALTANTNVDLNNKYFDITNSGEQYLFLDATVNAEEVRLSAPNTTGSGIYGYVGANTTDTVAFSRVVANNNNTGRGGSNIEAMSSTNMDRIVYSAMEHKFGGSILTSYTFITSGGAVTTFMHTVDCDGTFTLTLPLSTSLIVGKEFIITNSGAGTITLATTSSQTFNNVATNPTTLTLLPDVTVQVQSTGSGWIKLN